MNLKQAKQIPILWFFIDVLGLSGKESGSNIVFVSPFREDTTPSFAVSNHKNISYDYGTSESRDLVGSIQEYYKLGSTSEALKKLEELLRIYPVKANIDVQDRGYAQNTPQNQQKVPFKGFGDKKQSMTHNEDKNKREGFKTENRDIDILEEKDIFYFPVKNYLSKRKISVETAKLYQKEIWFRMKGKRYFGLSHKNISGGYEISGCGDNRFKCAVGNKDISFIPGIDENSKTVLIFEGIFDFMSYLEYEGTTESFCDVIILNTCALWKRGVEFVEENGKYEKVELYLDNDKVGKETAQNIIDELENTDDGSKKYDVVDKSSFYTGFKDFGEWWERK
jgi:5S rRNA maturation endonuclease (ribonuclease M5)